MELTVGEHNKIARKLIDRNVTWWCDNVMYELPEGVNEDDFGREAELITDDGKHWWYNDFNTTIKLNECKFRKYDKPSLPWLDKDIISYQFNYGCDGDSYIEMYLRIEKISDTRIRVTHIIPRNDDVPKSWVFKYPLV